MGYFDDFREEARRGKIRNREQRARDAKIARYTLRAEHWITGGRGWRIILDYYKVARHVAPPLEGYKGQYWRLPVQSGARCYYIHQFGRITHGMHEDDLKDGVDGATYARDLVGDFITVEGFDRAAAELYLQEILAADLKKHADQNASH